MVMRSLVGRRKAILVSVRMRNQREEKNSMYEEHALWIGTAEEKRCVLLPAMANRHGLIAGATGTGKTVTLKVMAESFSDCGVPVFLADVKGDLAGMCMPGEENGVLRERMERFGLGQTGFSFRPYPVRFWDIYGKSGIPLRTTISEMGPTLLARLMDLNQTQSDILKIVFRIADENGLLLLDAKDLRSMLQHVYENSKEYSAEYGNMAKQSISAITRAVVALEEEGADEFFGEPALEIRDWFSVNENGQGRINILDCQSLIRSPLMYSTFMLWMLSELFELLPEAGDLDKPKMVFFFDEAHLLFDHAPKALLQTIEQVVKLIRSKGVGIYFITQNPADIPDAVLSQLGNKVQHALHAYTPAEQKKVKAAASAFYTNPEFDTFEAITGLGIGEALVSFLDMAGKPSVVERVFILPPQSRMGAIGDSQREQMIREDSLFSRYGEMVDRESAYEMLMKRAEEQEEAREEEKKRLLQEKEEEKKRRLEEKEEAKRRQKEEREAEQLKKKQTAALGRVAKTATGTIGREVGNEIGQKIGGSFGKRLGGNLGAALGRNLLDTLLRR